MVVYYVKSSLYVLKIELSNKFSCQQIQLPDTKVKSLLKQ